MRPLLLILASLTACAPPASESDSRAAKVSIEIAGQLENPAIDEASGLARSGRRSGMLWVINDDGPSELHAISTRGRALGRVSLSASANTNWEDLASFTLKGVPYLLVADVGDNAGNRDFVTLYVVEEPDPDDETVNVAWRIAYRYPDGPKDAEAVAVDVANERVLILTKRDIPAILYEVPLQPSTEQAHMAKRLAAIASLPQPKRRHVEYATKTNDWYWQPTGLDLSADGKTAVILTYGGVFRYSRDLDENWTDALQRRPVVIGATRNREAESVAFGPDGDSIFVTLEQRNAPLIRFDSAADKSSQPMAVSIMTFNVQNLFDNTDDPDKDDKAYLPLAAKQTESHIAACNRIEVESWRNECLYLDWSDAAIAHKLGVLAEAIRQVDDGRGADIIALQEIENVAILEHLRNEYLAGSEYLPAVLIEGTDTRGIDVAFLSRLPLVGQAKLHPLVLEDFPDRGGDTRGILEATFELPDGSVLTGFSVHFPAPFHPTEMRVHAYNHLNVLRSKLPPERNVFAAGDFNTTSSEDKREGMLERFARPYWTVVHDACVDCPGTQYYARDDTWSFLDMILYSSARGAKTTWQIRANSVRLADATTAQLTVADIPNRYKAAQRSGVSDHLPLVVTIELTEKQ